MIYISATPAISGQAVTYQAAAQPRQWVISPEAAVKQGNSRTVAAYSERWPNPYYSCQTGGVFVSITDPAAVDGFVLSVEYVLPSAQRERWETTRRLHSFAHAKEVGEMWIGFARDEIKACLANPVDRRYSIEYATPKGRLHTTRECSLEQINCMINASPRLVEVGAITVSDGQYMVASCIEGDPHRMYLHHASTLEQAFDKMEKLKRLYFNVPGRYFRIIKAGDWLNATPTRIMGFSMQSVTVDEILAQNDVGQMIKTFNDTYCVAPTSSLTPWIGGNPPVGTWRMCPTFGHFDVLVEAPTHDIHIGEPEDMIKLSPSYQKYVEWLRAGLEPPAPDVVRNLNGQLVVIGRRRRLAAIEVGEPMMKVWLSETDMAIGRPLWQRKALGAISAYEKD